MSTNPQVAAPADAPHAAADVRPYIIKTYDRWIILVLVLVAGWLLFRPLFAFSVYYRGVSFEHMLRLRVAEHYYRKAISVDPKIPEGWLGLGELQMMRARSEPADYANTIDTFTRGLAFNPKSGVLAFSLCRAYYEIGKDYPHALAACQRGFQNDEQQPVRMGLRRLGEPARGQARPGVGVLARGAAPRTLARGSLHQALFEKRLRRRGRRRGLAQSEGPDDQHHAEDDRVDP